MFKKLAPVSGFRFQLSGLFMVLAGKNSLITDSFNIARFEVATAVVSWYLNLCLETLE